VRGLFFARSLALILPAPYRALLWCGVFKNGVLKNKYFAKRNHEVPLLFSP